MWPHFFVPNCHVHGHRRATILRALRTHALRICAMVRSAGRGHVHVHEPASRLSNDDCNSQRGTPNACLYSPNVCGGQNVHDNSNIIRHNIRCYTLPEGWHSSFLRCVRLGSTQRHLITTYVVILFVVSTF